jgi:hypothetical protein
VVEDLWRRAVGAGCYPPAAVPRRLAFLVILSLLLAATASAAARRNLYYRIPEDRLEAFAFETTHTVTTTVERLPPEAKPYDTAALVDRLDAWTATTKGSFERYVARIFRDQSLGVLSRVAGVEGTIDRGEGATPLPLEGLVGKSLALRVKPSGELLDAQGWDRFAGAGRGGELLEEVLLFSTLRLPVHDPKGGAVGATWNSRVRVDAHLLRESTWVLNWTTAEPPADCGRCQALAYEGSITEKSQDKHPGRPMDVAGQATVAGTVVLQLPSRQLVEHRWTVDWTRTVRSVRDAGDTRGALTQTVRSEGFVRRTE